MWSFQINRLLYYNNSFIGCYPYDTLPYIKRKSNISIVINTANSKLIGEHWVAIKMINNECFYFDSFGVGIVNENIKEFVKIYKNVIYSTRCIQNIESDKCGEFCVAFIKNVKCVESYRNFITSFSENGYINDIIVDTLI